MACALGYWPQDEGDLLTDDELRRLSEEQNF